MKRGHIILIAGGVLLVVGITLAAVSGVSFASNFISDNTVVAKTTIEPGQSVTTKTDVRDASKTLTLAVGIDRSAGQSVQSDIKMKETITDPQGQIVSASEFGDSFVTPIKPQSTGTYTVTITNLGNKAVPISGTFGYFPILDSNGKPDRNAIFGTGQQGLGMIIAGGVMTVAGVVVLIAGGIVTVADSRGQRGTSSTTTSSEGGIPYRKD